VKKEYIMTNNDIATSRCCDEYQDYRRSKGSFRQNRREFLRTTAGALAAAPMFPHLLLKPALAQHANTTGADTQPILVVIQLAGGNDGLNTIVPYGSNLYYAGRPNIAVPAKSVLPIDSTVGFNPNLKGMKALFDLGKVAIIENAGYANPSRSHFQGTTIWETGDPLGQMGTGWLGRYLDQTASGNDNPLAAIAIGSSLPQTLVSQRAPVTAIESVDSFKFLINRTNEQAILNAYQRMYGATVEDLPRYMGIVRSAGSDAEQGVKDLESIQLNYKPSVTYPTNPLGRELQLAAQIITSGIGTRVFHLSLGGFDDHVAEVYTHANLMKYLGDSVLAFYQDLQAHGKSDQVTMVTFSEFGRRVKENAGRGTDHGTAAPMFVVGGKVKGGLYGGDPSLTKLDQNGDLIYDIDFRSVYGTILDSWLGASSTDILGGTFERLPIF